MPSVIRRALTATTALALGLGGAVLVAVPAHAADFSVVNTSDDVATVGSLRWAVAQANDTDGQDTISIDAGLVITIGSPLILTEGVSVVGGFGTEITRSAAFDLFDIEPDGASEAQAYSFANLILRGDPADGNSGRAIDATTNVPFTSLAVSNAQIVGHREGSVGGAVAVANADNGPVSFSGNVVFNDNQAQSTGGAVYLEGVASVLFDGGSFTASESNDGGAVRIQDVDGDIRFNDFTFTGSEARTGGGGAVYISNVSAPDPQDGVRFTDVTFDQSTAPGQGGAVLLESVSQVVIQNSVFTRNHGQSHGGAVSIWETPSVYISGSVFGSPDDDTAGNTSRLRGGALYLEAIDGPVDIVETGFFDNQSTDDDPTSDGGAVHISGSGSVGIAAGDFDGNEAERGGAVYIENLVEDATITLFASVLTGNTARDSGGAVYVPAVATSMLVDAATFSGNDAEDGPGGALYVGEVYDDANLTITQSTFALNATTGEGQNGGAVFVGTNGEVVEIDASTFSNNNAEQGTGAALAIENNDGEVRMLNTTVDELIDNGAAAFIVGQTSETGRLDILSSTLVSSSGPAVELGVNSGVANLVNSIFASTGIVAVDLSDGNPFDATSNLFSSAYDSALIASAATNRFEIADMRLGALASNGGPTQTRLPLASSPARDAGDSDAAYLATTPYDQRGEGYPRLIGGLVDIGAVEVQPVLPVTGSSIPMWIPIVGGVVLLLGAAAVVFTVVSRRRLSASDAPAPSEPAAPDTDATPPQA